MEHQIKTLVEAITHDKLKKLVQSHVKELKLENSHLTLFVDNTAPLHELNEKSMDKHLKAALEKVYDPKTTYEIKSMQSHDKTDHNDNIPAQRMAH
jgi:thiamine phosphate synthase YjbQ (UPF0047 family)